MFVMKTVLMNHTHGKQHANKSLIIVLILTIYKILTLSHYFVFLGEERAESVTKFKNKHHNDPLYQTFNCKSNLVNKIFKEHIYEYNVLTNMCSVGNFYIPRLCYTKHVSSLTSSNYIFCNHVTAFPQFLICN